jgi:hypothetical protein
MVTYGVIGREEECIRNGLCKRGWGNGLSFKSTSLMSTRVWHKGNIFPVWAVEVRCPGFFFLFPFFKLERRKKEEARNPRRAVEL